MNQVKKYSLRFSIILISVLFLIGCDQTTKKAANLHLKDKAQREIAGIINLQYIENNGGMLSFGSKLPSDIKFLIFIAVVSVFLMILLFYILKNPAGNITRDFSLILILSGGTGNLIDRLINNGNVIDFIRIRLPIIENGIFNIADFYITLGFILLLLSSFLKANINRNVPNIS